MEHEWKDLRTVLPEYVYDPGIVLPEIIITPTKQTRIAKGKLRLMVPDKKLRKRLMNTNYMKDDEYFTIDRLYDIWKKAGQPKIQSFENLNWFDLLILHFADGNVGIKSGPYKTPFRHRAHYDPISNSMTVGHFSDLIPEMSHAYLYLNPNVPKGGLFNTGFGLPSDIEIMGLSGYDRYTNPEFIAHTIIEPFLDEYMQVGHPVYRNLNMYDEKISDAYKNPEKYGIQRNLLPLNNRDKHKPSNIIGDVVPMLKR